MDNFINSILFPVIAIVFLALGIAAAFFSANLNVGKYKAKGLLTENEREFFGRLVSALPAHFIFPQVAMSALIEASGGNNKTRHADFLRIAQHRVDFLICNAACRVVAVIELDDRTHNKRKDQVRDQRLMQASIPTIRYQSSSRPTLTQIQDAIAAVEQQASVGNS